MSGAPRPPASEAAVRWTGIAFGSFTLLLFLAVAAGEMHDAYLGRASQAWPTVPGVVTTARHNTGNLKRFEYEYTINHIRYTGRLGSFMHSSFHREYKLHDVGDTIQVHVDPEVPRRSVIRPGITVAGAIEKSVIVTLFLGVWVFCYVHIRRAR